MIVGTADGSEPEGLIDEFRVIARRARLDVLAGVHGHRLVVVLGGSDDPLERGPALRRPVRAGPGGGRPGGRRPAVGGPARPPRRWPGCAPPAAWPDAPRPVLASDLLPERALDGDALARAELIEKVYEPLQRGGSGAAGHRA